MRRKNAAFSLVEVVIGLFIVTMITVLIGALGQQAAQFSNKTKQIGTVLELRTKIAALSKDPEEFIKKMQVVSAGGTSQKFSSCLPSATGAPTTSFSCPPVKPALLNPSSALYDVEIKKHASNVYKVTDTDLVDSGGNKIAGTIDNPLYLSGDGFECSATPKNKKCPLMSTGYFFRSNAATNSDPGSVKFLVKVQSNPESILINSGTTPMKAQYMSIDLGRQWSASAAPCPSSSIQVGVKPDGSSLCLVPVNCGPSSLLVGVKSNASPDCKSIPACENNKRIVLNDDGDLECVGNSPCDVGEAHLGYYSGTSDPICSSPTSCENDEVLLGTRCEKIDNCQGSERLTFTNNTFSCSAVASATGECRRPGEFLVGFNSDGSPKCEAGIAGQDGKDGARGKEGDRGVAGEQGEAGLGVNAGSCADGEVMYGIRPNGSLICRSMEMSCDDGFYMNGISEDGEPICKALPTTPPPSLPTISQACSSNDYRYATCAVASLESNAIVSKVSVSTRYSNSKCELNVSYGILASNKKTIWVDHGCRANFRIIQTIP